MKGVILAGGRGTRLYPLTKVVNKHLLPVGRYPMIYWPLRKLQEANIQDVLIIVNENELPLFERLVDEKSFIGMNIQFITQDEARGIADAVYKAKDFVKDSEFLVLLGDNIFEDSLDAFLDSYRKQGSGGKVLLKRVEDVERYGMALLNEKEKKIQAIIEKPTQPLSNYCVTGIYIYDQNVFKYIEEIEPSRRGELEITDVNNAYIRNNQLTYDLLQGWWIDAGTHDAFYKVNQMVTKGELFT